MLRFGQNPINQCKMVIYYFFHYLKEKLTFVLQVYISTSSAKVLYDWKVNVAKESTTKKTTSIFVWDFSGNQVLVFPLINCNASTRNYICLFHLIPPGQPPVTLSPGIHSFPFKLGLPPGLPSTFLGKSGWVQYYCKAALREPNSLTHKNQQVFIVMNPIDLNMEPSILSVVTRLDEFLILTILLKRSRFRL